MQLLLNLYLLLALLLLLLLFDLLLDDGLLFLLDSLRLLLQIVLAVVVITRMIFLHLLGVEIVVPDVLLGILAWLPRARERRFEAFFGDIE